jgi:hypothetical protein
VVVCRPGSPPAAWILLRWPDGTRTSVCADLSRRRC